MNEPVIVVGVNGTPSSAAALRWAAAEADARGARLRVIHVYDVPQLAGPGRPEVYAEIETAARVEARQWVIDALGAVRAAAVRVDAVAGDPGPVLVGAANRATLLVLGVRGYGKYSHLTVPKIARFCLGRSRVPVVVVPAPAPVQALRSA